MKDYELSVIVPSRCEMFLSRTVEDLLKNMSGNTEIIVVLDGEWADPPLPKDDRVTVIHHSESIGQRAATNEAAKLSKAKYLMKCDAHCCFDEGFDVKMMAEMRDDWTMVPLMKNFHIFDWVCEQCGWRKYQGPTPEKCGKCGSKNVRRDIVWHAKSSPNSISYCFDSEPHFQYFGEYSKRPEALAQGHLRQTMSLQGSCFIITRGKYFELNICDDEMFGSWGSQGIEVACKTWLSGGEVRCNLNTWYAHMFRTQGGDFSFPYALPGTQVRKAKMKAKEIFFNNRWPQQIHPLSWLVKKFWPVRGWTQEELDKLVANEKYNWKNGPVDAGKPSRGMIFYTDSQLDPKISDRVQKQLEKIGQQKGMQIVTSSLRKTNFGDKATYFPSLRRGYLTMFKQIYSALEHSESEVIFFTEHDVLYHESHFDFTPPKKDVFYYNTNVYRLRLADGLAVRTDDCRQVSGLCAYRELLLDHYKKRIEIVEGKLKELGKGEEFNRFIRTMGFEAGTHGRIKEFSHLKSERWESEYPNVDIKHKGALTQGKWKPEDYRNKRFAKGWKEIRPGGEIPGWGVVKI